MVKCEKCVFIDDYAFCPHCGSKSDVCKSSAKGRIFARADKTLATGVAFLIAGIMALGALLILGFTLLFGVALAIVAFGMALLIRGKLCIKINMTSKMQCKYCSNELEQTWKFCCKCGSRINCCQAR